MAQVGAIDSYLLGGRSPAISNANPQMVLLRCGGALNRSRHLTSGVGAGKFDYKSRAEEPRKGALNGRPQNEAEKATGSEKRKPATTIHRCPIGDVHRSTWRVSAESVGRSIVVSRACFPRLSLESVEDVPAAGHETAACRKLCRMAPTSSRARDRSDNHGRT